MPYSDSTLQRMTKVELIEQLRCAEHNQKVAEEMLAQQAENIKDWVQVVRCRECKYYRPSKVHYMHCAYPGGMLCPPDANVFCSYGQRKNQSADVRNIGQFAGDGKMDGGSNERP